MSSQHKRAGTNKNWAKYKIDGDKTAGKVDWTKISGWEELELNKSNAHEILLQGAMT